MKEDIFYCEKCGETHYLKSTKEHKAICPNCAVSMEFCESVNYTQNNTPNNKLNQKQESEFNIEEQKLYLLTDIHKMLKLFYMLLIINLAAVGLLILYIFFKLIAA
jgi:tRNA G26 N,N-dimethylase Trm1